MRSEQGRRLAKTPAALALALALAAALIIGLNVRGRGVTSEHAEVLGAVALHAVSPVGDLGNVPGEFRWTYVQDAAAYVLTVMDADGAVVLQEKVTAQRLAVPPRVGTLLRTGQALQWSVTAIDGSGREIASTGILRFRLDGSDAGNAR